MKKSIESSALTKWLQQIRGGGAVEQMVMS